MSITPSYLRHALNRVVKASSHPNALAYKIQLTGATQKYLERGPENGAIDFPRPSSTVVIDGSKDIFLVRPKLSSTSCTIEEKSVMKELQGEENGTKDLAGRRFMSLASHDSIVGFLWNGSGSAV